ncbi:hypothetical protein AbraIFM66950_000204, partial [Aspergillus brasiliensis]
MPNGARILDKLGLWEKIECYVEPLAKPVLIYPGAFQVESSYPRVMRKRFHYPITFIDRQSVLQVLYEGYPCPERIRLSEKVIAIESSDDVVTVITANGETYKGHIICRGRCTTGPAQSRGKNCSSCIFGISSPIEGMSPGGQVHVFAPGLSITTVHGKRGRLYWFLTQKLKRKYIWPDRPRYTDDDMADAAARLDSFRVYEDVTFGHIWKAREVATMEF